MALRTALLLPLLAAAPVLPQGTPVEIRPPDVAAELAAFAPEPPRWNADVVNALYGGTGPVGAKERRDGWLSEPENWRLVDSVVRAYNLTTHGWLERRGIRADSYGFNEYQETIALDESAALSLFAERGLARGPYGELVRDPNHDRDAADWRAIRDDDAYIADPLEPRWAAVLRYDMLTSPLFADAISQDNLGMPLSRTGPSALGRFGDAAQRGFAAWRARRGAPAAPTPRAHLREQLAGPLAALSPYAPSADVRAASGAAQALCADPLFADYQLYLHAAHLHAFARHYADLRRVAARAGREYDVHGNVGAGVIGADAYPIALGELVDSLFFESAGVAEYDQVRNGWWNALGSLRLGLSEALARGRKPSYFLTRLPPAPPDLYALDLAEVSAGGAVPLLFPDGLQSRAPELAGIAESFLRLRDANRALYAPRGRARLADTALLYSVATFVFDPCLPGASSSASAPLSNLSGAARALEEAHVAYEVVVLGHPQLAGARRADPLAGKKLAVAPSLENLSDADLDLLERFLARGGALAVLGKLGARDERNRPRSGDAFARLSRAGRVRVLLDGAQFPAARVRETSAVRAQAKRFGDELAKLAPPPLLSGELPRSLWSKAWTHGGGRASFHFVNYDVDAASGRARPTPALPVELRVPAGVEPRARWLVPGEPERALLVERRGDRLALELPPVRVHGVLAFGPGEPARADDRVARAAERERAYLASIARLAEFGDPVLALAFGKGEPPDPFLRVGADTGYRSERGYGWLAPTDASLPTPEETAYEGAAKLDGQVLTPTQLVQPWWPWDPAALPRALREALISGRAQRLRLDLPDGEYRFEVVTTNGHYQHRNHLVSGMVFADGRPVLLDAPLQSGELLRREFDATVRDGSIELGFGGPTGFGVVLLVVSRAEGPGRDARARDRLEAGGLREWSVSARHPNPDWAELEDIVVPTVEPATTVRAVAEGLPLVDLGTLSQAQIGDVVVARALVTRASAGSARLSVGASSAAHVYVNGKRVGVVPNVKGVERDEQVVPVTLRAGENRIELVLERFWERRWMFYASLI
jgi:hypothetical protein